MPTENEQTFVKQSQLPSGVRVATRELPDTQSVALGIFIDVGSRDESDDLAGISHALEHMVFKGTHKLNVHQLAEGLDALGGNANAFTSRERTCFHTHVLHEDWQQGLHLLSDMLLHPALPEDEWQREREVIYSEMSMVDDAPDEWVYDQHMAQLFAKQSMGKPVLGTRKNLAAFSTHDLRHYLDRHYRGKNVVIAAAGRIKHEDVIKFIEQSALSEWGELQGEKRSERTPPTMTFGQFDLPRQMEQAQVVGSWQAGHVNAADKPVAWVGNQLLGGSMSSVLFREIREKRGLAYSVGSHLSAYTDTGMLSISCGTMPDQLHACKDVLHDTIADVCAGVSLAMVQRAQRQLVVQFRMGMDSVEGSMLQLGALLDERQLYSPLQWVEKVKQVEPEQVQTWLKTHLEAPVLWTVAAPEQAL